MSSNHSHHHGHHHQHGTGNITLAFWLNTGFAVIELIGGILTNSVAIMSDALHDFGDSFSLATAWYFQRKSAKKRDETYTYGYKRFSLLGAFINSLVLVIGSVFVIKESVGRLFDPQQPDAKGMIWLAVLGIAVNLIAMLRLKKGSSVNERVVSLHFLEDVLGWVAVLAGAIVMLFADVPILDPLLSIGIAGFILLNVYRNLKAAFQIILQGVPEEVSEENIKQTIRSFPQVKTFHDLHVWTMDGEYNVLSAHVVVNQNLTLPEAEILKHQLKESLKQEHIQHATIEIELENNVCEQVTC
jgi:cobalt-zinc-cadmium efflux system protein